MSLLRFIIVAITTSFLLVGCSFVDRWVYRPDINQGNYLTQEAVDKLKVGQNKEQVLFIMGSPMLTSIFGDDIWYYVFRQNPQHGYTKQITYTISFNSAGNVADIKRTASDNTTLDEME